MKRTLSTAYRRNPFRLILAGFFLVILLGALLLTLPVASRDGLSAPFEDALFTATSAVCVTGLIVRDTATGWSAFGQTIIILLIQIGGLGVVTVAAATLLLTGQRIGIFQRTTMQEAVAAPKLGGIVRFTKFILTATFTIEGIGALLLLPTFLRDYPVGKAVCFSLFHSISAFCNAGFDLLGEKLPFGSLAIYSDSIPVNLVIAGLIIMGGIGFLTMQDLIQNRLNFHRLRLQTKIILITTALLIAVPTLLFFLFEFQDHPLKERILLSFFQSVTPRTAGFGTCDYGAMSDRGLLLTILLMLSGGAPGSTAGGIKVTTVWVLIAASIACLSQKQDVDGFHRRVDPETIRTALTLSFLYTVLLIGGSLVISYLEGETIIRTMFECASALATVGLTAGMTPSLCLVSKLILIVFMYFGRVGALTLAYAAASRQPVQHMRYPEEKIIVG